MPEKDQGLVTIRMENILTWGEHVQVDRGTDEEEDLERAKTAAKDMDRISVARDRRASGRGSSSIWTCRRSARMT